MIRDLVNSSLISKSELTDKEKKRANRELKKALKKELKELSKIDSHALYNDYLRALDFPPFILRSEDKVCCEYNLPVSGYTEIKQFLSESYYLTIIREILLIKEIYIVDKESFSKKQKRELLEILKVSNKYMSLLYSVATHKNIQELHSIFDEIESDRVLLQKYNELIHLG